MSGYKIVGIIGIWLCSILITMTLLGKADNKQKLDNNKYYKTIISELKKQNEQLSFEKDSIAALYDSAYERLDMFSEIIQKQEKGIAARDKIIHSYEDSSAILIQTIRRYEKQYGH